MGSTSPIRVVCIVSVRPNFMKMTPILSAFAAHVGFDTQLIHTGQHYDVEINAVFFEQLGLSEPDINLEIGSCSQTVQIMMGLEGVFTTKRPEFLYRSAQRYLALAVNEPFRV